MLNKIYNTIKPDLEVLAKKTKDDILLLHIEGFRNFDSWYLEKNFDSIIKSLNTIYSVISLPTYLSSRNTNENVEPFLEEVVEKLEDILIDLKFEKKNTKQEEEVVKERLDNIEIEDNTSEKKERLPNLRGKLW